jgi:hypothetical protein
VRAVVLGLTINKVNLKKISSMRDGTGSAFDFHFCSMLRFHSIFPREKHALDAGDRNFDGCWNIVKTWKNRLKASRALAYTNTIPMKPAIFKDNSKLAGIMRELRVFSLR